MNPMWAGVLALMLAGPAAAQEHVSFPTSDGGLVDADQYGEGGRGVVLAHGGRFNKESWGKQAQMLVRAGFRVLAIDFRGEGQSRGGIQGRPPDEGRPFDVLAAVHYLRNAGAKSVSVVGASMGGDYAAEAAETEPAEIDRLVLLASGAYTPLVRMKGRKLFILARDDANADGPRLPRIREQYEKASEPKEMVILDGSAHAQYLFQTSQGDRLMSEILRFLSEP
jgi:alpha-beta hydrolase superfamily lysophospholipase